MKDFGVEVLFFVNLYSQQNDWQCAICGRLSTMNSFQKLEKILFSEELF